MLKDKNAPGYTYVKADGAERMIEITDTVTGEDGDVEIPIRLKTDADGYKLDIINSTVHNSPENPEKRAVFVMKDGTTVDSRGSFSALVY